MNTRTLARRAITTTAIAALGLAVPVAAGASTNQAKIAHWYLHQGGKSNLRSIVNAISSVQSAADADNLSALGSGCQSLRNAAEVAMEGSPIPVKADERLWSSGVSAYASGASACINGANNDAVGPIHVAISDFLTGNALIGQLDKVLHTQM